MEQEPIRASSNSPFFRHLLSLVARQRRDLVQHLTQYLTDNKRSKVYQIFGVTFLPALQRPFSPLQNFIVLLRAPASN